MKEKKITLEEYYRRVNILKQINDMYFEREAVE